MDFKDETRELNQIPIPTVGRWLGVTLPSSGKVCCPFHDHNESIPSFEVRQSGNRWICYGCNRSGGSIDFVMVHQGISFIKAKQWLASHAQVPPSFRSLQRIKAPSISAKTLKNELEAESTPDSEVYEAFLQLSPLQSSGRNYLSARCISNKNITAFRIGQMASHQVTIQELLRNYGFSRVNNAGLLTRGSTRGSPRMIFPEGSLVFPFLEENQVAYFQARLISGSKSQGKWRNLNYRNRRIYNVDAVYRKEPNSIAICEGVIDTLSAIELGFRAIGILGVSTEFTAEQMAQLRGKNVNILLDWDNPGEKGAAELQKRMRRLGITSTRKNCPSPSITDLNEYLVELRGQA